MNAKFEYPRDFEGIWIPRDIYLDRNLTPLDIIIYTEITSLDRHRESDGDYCYASNDYLADFCKCSKRKVTDSISKLTKLGYIRVVKNDGRKRWLESSSKSGVAKFATLHSKKCDATSQILPQSNITINIDDKYKVVLDKSKHKVEDEEKDEYNIPKTFSCCISNDHLNTIYHELIKRFLEAYKEWSGKEHPKYSSKYWDNHITELHNAIYNCECRDMLNDKTTLDMVDYFFDIEHVRSNRHFACFANSNMTTGIVARLCDGTYEDFKRAEMII